MRLDHPELSGKISNYPYIDIGGNYYNIDWSENDHGTHVAGIIAAAKNDTGMQGVAYNASIYAIGYLAYMSDGTRSDPIIPFSSVFSEHSYIRIYNNSYGPAWRKLYDPTTNTDTTTYRGTLSVNPENNPDIVFVFGAGNDGEYTPSSYGLYPRYQGAGQVTNLISVGSLNNAGISTNASGNLVLTSGAVSYYSNLAGGAELWNVFAPGSNIYSLNAVDNGYTTMSGTSMATPVVSGALALVLEAYPWFSGKQLADAILTTANNDFTAPEFILSTNTDSGKTYVRWIDTASTMSESEYRALFTTKCESTFGAGSRCTSGKSTTGETYYWVYDSDDNIAGIYMYDFSKVEFQTLTKEQVFGQGILDVGKAVQGIARLDANRMSASDVVNVSELDSNKTYALETFDTQGYSGEFSNDITSREWDDKYHYDTSSADASALKSLTGGIGLLKTGEGTLILSGTNSYTGATVIEDGILNISKRSKTTSAGNIGTGGIVQGSGVVVRENGTLTGNGEIWTHVVNNGTLVSSVYLGNGLSVQSINSTGTINITIQEGASSNVSGALIINNSLGNSTTMQTSTISGNLNIEYLMSEFVKNEQSYTTSSPFISATESRIASAATTSISVDSPTLGTKDVVVNDDYTATFTFMRESNAYLQYAKNTNEANVGSVLYQVSEQVSSSDLVANLLSAIDWSASGSDVASALSDIYYSPEIFYTSISGSLRQQTDFNQMILAQTLSLDLRKKGEWSAWITPFGLYNSKFKSGNVGYSSWSAGALLGMDANIGNGSFGFHLGIANRAIYLDSNDESSTLGVYLGSHGKVDMKYLYLVFAYRLGFEFADITRDISINGSTYEHENDQVNMSLSALLGLGYDFKIQNFSLGPLVFAQYSHLVRTLKNDSTSDVSLPLNSERNYNASSVAAGAKFGYQISELMALDFYALYRRELLKTNITESVYFSGYSSSAFGYSTNLFDKDYGVLQASFKMFGAEFGGYLGASISAEISKSSYSVSGSLELGYRF